MSQWVPSGHPLTLVIVKMPTGTTDGPSKSWGSEAFVHNWDMGTFCL
jgi:hypothetical protein